MTQYWKSTALVLALAACSEKHPEKASQPRVAPAPAATPAAPAVSDSAATGPENLAPTPVPATDVPMPQRLPGRLLEAWRWPDSNGDNLLVVYQDGPRRYRGPVDADQFEAGGPYEDDQGNTGTLADFEERSIWLRARQYVRQPGGPYRELWRLQDTERHCPLELRLALLPNSTAVTDLDHDGQTETTLLYYQSCRSDVSPTVSSSFCTKARPNMRFAAPW